MSDKQRTVRSRLRHAWNAFRNKDPGEDHIVVRDDEINPMTYSPMRGGFSVQEVMPKRFRYAGMDRSIAIAIFERIATDCSLVDVKHVRVSSNDGYEETINDGLNHILSVEANIDQTGREFLKDLVLTMLDGKGVAAAVPVDTTVTPDMDNGGSFDVVTMRVGTVVDWLPQSVQVEVYNERSGLREQIWLPKRVVALVVNPFRNVMNEPNSTLARLTRKLALLDDLDDEKAHGKLDLIIQLPYVIRSEARKQEAEKRRGEIENQLAESPYGIAYADGTEKIVQLNRAIENNLLPQIEYLTKQLFSQLGLTQEILDGTATESAMINYYNRTINPIMNAICDEFERKFLTKTARTQRQAIRYYRDPFQLTTSEQIAEIADKFTRNAILSSNEMRSVIGFNPVEDERANELRNKNLNATDAELDQPILVDEGGGRKTDSLENQNEGVEE